MDRRITATNGRVAAIELQGKVSANRFVEGEVLSITRPIVDLRESPDGMRDRQLLLGAQVRVFEAQNGWSFVRSERDGYVGYVETSTLGSVQAPTHFVQTFATHVYPEPDFKTRENAMLNFGARVAVVFEHRKFWETTIGFIPKSHLRQIDMPLSDPATVAALHFGVPYLWGGNSTLGIDCSGLVQASLHACNIDCPADSDMQLSIGTDAPGLPMRRDLVFWKGHVAMMVDDETLIHANAHHMAVRYEPFQNARLRIAAQGDGEVIAIRRL